MRGCTALLLSICLMLGVFATGCAVKTDPAALQAGQEARKLILVVGRPAENPAAADVLAYEKTGASWRLALAAEGTVGRNGIAPQRAEGSGLTPAGVFSFGAVFGIAADPGALKPYTRLTEYDVWVDDPGSRHYNAWMRADSPDKDWNSAEELFKETVAYRYVAAVNFNTNPVVRGAGSAVFLHCAVGRPTAGCVAVPEADMIALLRFIDDDTLIVIARSPEELARY